MKQWLGVLILVGFFATGALALGNGPEISVVDDKLSVNVDSIPLGRLLGLLDRATGMQSKVPAELANRSLSVRFSGLSFDDAVKKIFQGQPYDYVVIGRQGIIVTAMSQGSGAGPEPGPAFAAAPAQVVEQPFMQDIQPPQAFPPIPPGQQPAIIQTPFGPIANPRANQPAMPNGNQPIPGQMPTPIFGAPPGFGMPVGGTPPGGGTPNSNGQNGLFGNTPIFQNPGIPGTTGQAPRQ
ncbi:MAG TPA: hypothetical protein VE422_36130 [Terriglobia bacterium]|nr:hypothetical protein [Terriglobia bacterium]